MFDRIGARLNAIVQTLASKRMASGFLAVTMRFIYDSVNFFLRERRIAEQLAARLKFIVRGRMKLDPVGAIMDLFPNSLPRRPGTVHGLIIPWEADLRRAQNPFAGGHQAHRRNLHARTLEVTTIDRP